MSRSSKTIPGIFERPTGSGVWWISYFDRTQKRRREKIGRRADAINAYHDRKRAIRENRYTPPRERGAITFANLAARAMDDKKLKLAPLSYSTDRRRLAALLPFLGKMVAESIQVEELESVLARLRHKGLTGSTAN